MSKLHAELVWLQNYEFSLLTQVRIGTLFKQVKRKFELELDNSVKLKWVKIDGLND